MIKAGKLLLLFACLLPFYATSQELTLPQKAVKRLMEGNDRYVHDALEHPNRTSDRREALSSTQNPFATIVGCSDSRVSPEILFDQGIGDLFVVRVAGNVLGPIVIESIEYSVLYLGSSLIFVLGHENCGAVNAVLQNQTKDIEPIAEQIQSALKNYPARGDTPLERAIKANVTAVVAQLKRNPILAKLIEEKKLGVVGGYYQLSSGKVELCCELPEGTQTGK